MFRSRRSLIVSLIAVPVLLGGSLAGQTRVPIGKAPPGKTIVPTAPPPQIGSIGGSPTTTSLTWVAPATGARLLQFEVTRWYQTNPGCCTSTVVIPAGQSSDAKWIDYDFPLAGIYVYRIVSSYADGAQGTVQIDYARPEPVNPASLTAVQTALHQAELTWPEVQQASFYQVWGPGLASTGLTVANDGTPTANVVQRMIGGVRHFVLTVAGVPGGTRSWNVGSYYQPPTCTSVPIGQPCPKVSTVATAFTQGSVSMALRWQLPTGQ